MGEANMLQQFLTVTTRVSNCAYVSCAEGRDTNFDNFAVILGLALGMKTNEDHAIS